MEGRTSYAKQRASSLKRLNLSCHRNVKKIVEAQESSGTSITKNDRFKKRMPAGERWNGQYLGDGSDQQMRFLMKM